MMSPAVSTGNAGTGLRISALGIPAKGCGKAEGTEGEEREIAG